MSDRDVARIGAALCDALEHAHPRGVIHRDVKPQNVMVVAEPAAGAGFAKLADFGVAHVATADPLTRTGDMVGTLAYMAPEQAEGERVTPACDVYSLALTLYEAWTGTNPVRAARPRATARRLGRPLPPLHAGAATCRAAVRRDRPGARARPGARPRRQAARGAERGRDGALGRGRAGRAGDAAARRARDPTRRGAVRRRREERREPRVRSRRGALPACAARDPAAPAARPGESPPGSPPAASCSPACPLGPDPSFSPSPRPGSPRSRSAAPAAARLDRSPRSALCALARLAEADRQGTALPRGRARAGRRPPAARRAALVRAGARAAARHDRAGARLRRRRRARGHAWRRAGLAAAGFWWLAARRGADGQALLFGAPDGVAAARDWEGSISAAASDALGPLLTSPALAPALAGRPWRSCSPLVVRGRWLALDLLGAGVWAAALIAAHAALGRPARRDRARPRARRRGGLHRRGARGARGATRPARTAPRWPTGLRVCPRPGYSWVPMSMLSNLEAKLEGLVEGAFGRAFKSSVQPVELARKLAKEMEDNKTVSVSRVYVPNQYLVFLSPQDREQFASYEPALRKELSDYLLEHAREERSRSSRARRSSSRPTSGSTSASSGSRRALAPPEEERREGAAGPAPRPATSATRWSTRPSRDARRTRAGRRPRPGAARRRGPPDRARGSASSSAGAATATWCSTTRTSRAGMPSCAATAGGWLVVDLGSTNGIKVNGRRVDQPPLEPGDQITLGLTELTFESSSHWTSRSRLRSSSASWRCSTCSSSGWRAARSGPGPLRGRLGARSRRGAGPAPRGAARPARAAAAPGGGGGDGPRAGNDLRHGVGAMLGRATARTSGWTIRSLRPRTRASSPAAASCTSRTWDRPTAPT